MSATAPLVAQQDDVLFMDGFEIAGPTISLFGTYQDDPVSVANPPQNPFDLIAEVTFTARTSGTVRRSQVFWTGSGNQYAWRFFAERQEIWDWQIAADGISGVIESTTSVPELDGLSGSIVVTPDPDAYGLIVADGARFARQKGSPAVLEGFTPVWRTLVDESDASQLTVPAVIVAAADKNAAEGAIHFWGLTVAGRWANRIDSTNASPPGRWVSGSRNPDPSMFDFLERLFEEARSVGGTVSFFMFGDGVRGQDAVTAFGPGWNDSVEWHRLARYIAARFGAYPNWGADFGFDINEDHTDSEINDAFNDLLIRMGWPHLLGARDQNNSPVYALTSIDNRGYDSHGSPGPWPLMSYDEIKTYLAGKTVPQVDYDRFHNGRLTETELRRLIHRVHIAGGLGEMIGGDPSGSNFINRDWFHTAFTAWSADKNRFHQTVDADDLISGSGAVGGRRKQDGSKFIFYVEASGSSQTLDLSSASSGTLSVKRIDLAAPYFEDLNHPDVVNAANQTVSLPSSSDWLLVIGEPEGSAALSWTPPSENEDGSPLTDLAGYRIYYGTISGQYPNMLEVQMPDVSNFTVDKLGTGTYFFSVAAFNQAGLESEKSNEVSKTISP